MAAEPTETETQPTRAYVLHPDIMRDRARRAAAPALAEAIALSEALPGLEIAGAQIVALSKITPATLFGSGKVAELAATIAQAEVELVLVDGPLSPVQQRNLERAWKVKILDRTGLILEIFSDRARTREGVLQVEMAALSYQRTRLVRAWTHLERQRGGLGFVGGPGETQIEADRRAIDDHLKRLGRQLEKVVRTRGLHRAARAKVPYPIVALVGYTNAGKSTLFNRLTGSDVLSKDMLFATLDPTMRRFELPGGPEIILSDTVGFISALPTELVASFRATLEEVRDADLIVHVRDISHDESEAQAADVEAILGQLDLDGTAPILELWNKIDLVPDPERAALDARLSRRDDALAVSAVSGEGLTRLAERMAGLVSAPKLNAQLTLDHSDGRRRAWLYAEGVVKSETATETATRLQVVWTPRQAERFAEL